jgi:DNA-binding transcriptional MerR regulator
MKVQHKHGANPTSRAKQLEMQLQKQHRDLGTPLDDVRIAQGSELNLTRHNLDDRIAQQKEQVQELQDTIQVYRHALRNACQNSIVN